MGKFFRAVGYVIFMLAAALSAFFTVASTGAEKSILPIVLSVFLSLLVLWNLVFYFISRFEPHALLTVGLVFQIIFPFVIGIVASVLDCFTDGILYAIVGVMITTFFSFIPYLGKEGLENLKNNLIALAFIIGILCGIGVGIYQLFK